MKHGGDLTEARARFGEGPPAWLDLSTGINPHAWPVPAGLDLGLEALPSQADLESLLGAARAAYHVPDGLGIVAAPGTQALINWLPHLAPFGPVAVLGPTYAEHAEAWRAGGFDVRAVTALADLPDETRHVVVVNPNNPDGQVLGVDELVASARRCEAVGGWLVIDESFADLDPGASLVPILGDEPAIVLRSFGKFYGLAGLRLGFAIAPRALACRIEGALGPWAVSGPALAIGSRALAALGWAAAMRLRLADEATALDAVLTGGGLEIVGGTSLFRLARHPRAACLHAGLARRHIWTRRFDEAPDRLRFGLPPDASARERLAQALQEC